MIKINDKPDEIKRNMQEILKYQPVGATFTCIRVNPLKTKTDAGIDLITTGAAQEHANEKDYLNNNRCEVIAVGPGFITKEGTFPLQVKPGDTVVIGGQPKVFNAKTPNQFFLCSMQNVDFIVAE